MELFKLDELVGWYNMSKSNVMKTVSTYDILENFQMVND